MKILNLTQHKATPDQIAEGVYDYENHNLIQQLITFDEMPTFSDMIDRADELAKLVIEEGADAAMIGGAPYFMPILEFVLFRSNITPLYSFSKRVSEDTVMPDGTIQKTSVFKHRGFYEATPVIYEFARKNY